jgi:hypothetical protein
MSATLFSAGAGRHRAFLQLPVRGEHHGAHQRHVGFAAPPPPQSASRRFRSRLATSRYKSYCTVAFIPATGARSALNHTRQESIRRCIPARRLKPLPAPSHLNIP